MSRRALAALTAFVGMFAAAAPAASAAQGGDDQAFCDTNADLSLLFNSIDEAPTPKQSKKIDRLLERAESTAPVEIADPVETAADAVRSSQQEGPGFDAAIQAIDEWAFESCDFETAEVVARDYSFSGIPETVDRGVAIFAFSNEGAELHEIIVVRIKGDQSLDELLALPEKKVEKKIEFIGADFAAQGETTYAYFDLEKPGRYGAVCFLPVGSTDPDAAETADGPPHAAEGMAAEFSVQGGA
jgi:hypothetical protein